LSKEATALQGSHPYPERDRTGAQSGLLAVRKITEFIIPLKKLLHMRQLLFVLCEQQHIFKFDFFIFHQNNIDTFC
jgi:hypothetical protein